MSEKFEQRSQQLLKNFDGISDWEARYRKIIELGKTLPALAESKKQDEALVKGCTSKVWLHAHLEGSQVVFEADSDALIVKGIVSMLLQFYSRSTPDEIIATPPVFIESLGLQSNLTPSRANGLHAMVKQMKYFALAFKAQLT